MEHFAFVLAQAAPPAPPGAPAQQGDFIGGFLVPFACIAVIFYFLIIRPQRKRQQEQDKLVASLKTGDRVVTSGGIHGLVANVKEKTVLVKVADNVKIEMEKSSIATVVKKEVAAPAAPAGNN